MSAVALSAVVFLAGCASFDDLGIRALNAGNLPLAETRFNQAIQTGSVESWNNLGVVHQRAGRMDQAVSAYTLAARYGNPTAQQNLLLLGKPVPPADLAPVRQVAAESSGGAALAASLAAALAEGYADGKQSALDSARAAPAKPVAPGKTTCESKYNQFTKKVTTVCQ